MLAADIQELVIQSDVRSLSKSARERGQGAPATHRTRSRRMPSSVCRANTSLMATRQASSSAFKAWEGPVPRVFDDAFILPLRGSEARRSSPPAGRGLGTRSGCPEFQGHVKVDGPKLAGKHVQADRDGRAAPVRQLQSLLGPVAGLGQRRAPPEVASHAVGNLTVAGPFQAVRSDRPALAQDVQVAGPHRRDVLLRHQSPAPARVDGERVLDFQQLNWTPGSLRGGTCFAQEGVHTGRPRPVHHAPKLERKRRASEREMTDPEVQGALARVSHT